MAYIGPLGGPHEASTPLDLERLRAEVHRDPDALAAYQDTSRHGQVLEAMSQTRKRAGLSQAAAANLMGTTQSAVSSLESGRIDPQLSTMQRYARATHQRFDFAFVDDTQPVFDEIFARELWNRLEAQALSPLLTLIATGREDQRSLQALATAVNLPIAIVTPILNSLVARGWITVSVDAVEPIFSFSDVAGHVIGISVEREQIVGCLVDIHTNAVGVTRSRSLLETHTGYVVDAIVDIVAQLGKDALTSRICGVGISIAGVVDEAGTVRFASDLQNDSSPWSEVPLKALVEDKLRMRVGISDLNVVVEKHANALAMREHIRSGPHSVAAVSMVGDGITLGLVLKGQIVHGVHGAAGEGGHIIVDPNGAFCRANFLHQGCLETVASARAILDRLGRPTISNRDIEEGLLAVNVMVEQNEKHAITALDDAGRHLGSFLATSMTLLDPERLTLFAHPQLADRSRYRSAQVYQEGVKAGFRACQSIVEPIYMEWSVTVSDTYVTSAGAAAIKCFLDHPAIWQPAVLRLTPANMTDRAENELLISR